MENRIFTLDEVSRYLKLDKRTVVKLAENGNIPAIKLGDAWRFREDFLETWMETQMARGFSGYFDFSDLEDDELFIHSLVPENGINLSLESTTKYDVLIELVNQAELSGFVSKRRKLIFSLLERENLCSTALSNGLAIPHPRFRMRDIVRRPFIIVGRSSKGVDFEAPDGKPTYLFFLICLRSDELHVQVLARLSRLLRDNLFVKDLCKAKDEAEVLNIIKKAEQKII